MLGKITRARQRLNDLAKRMDELGVPPVRGALLFAQYHFLHGHTLENFFNYRLYDPSISTDCKREFLPRALAEHIWSVFNPPLYSAALTNKYIFHCIAHSAGLAVPKLYGIFDPVSGFTPDGRDLKTQQDLARTLEDRGVDRLIIKPVEGMQARFVYMLDHIRHGTRFADLQRGEISLEELVAELTDHKTLKAGLYRAGRTTNFTSFLLQERLEQHPALSKIAGPRLSPFRILTLVNAEGQPKVIGAKLHLLDHRSAAIASDAGAIECPVDLDRGIIGEGVTTKSVCRSGIKKAPAGEEPFAGSTSPFWTEAKDLAIRAAASFPFCRAVGWDVAVTPQGPVLLEGNARWGFTSLQASKGEGLYKGDFKKTYQALVSEMPNRPRRTLPLR